MSDELTPREHDDMRDLLLAGTQRIRPAASHRAKIAAAFAVVLVAGTVGGITATALYAPERGDPPAAVEPSPALTPRAPIVTEPSDPTSPWWLTASVPPPARGTHSSLDPVPGYDDQLILGSGIWLEAQGIDIASAQGFQSVGLIHPWIADMQHGGGQCILIRKDYSTGGWSEVVCDTAGAAASVERRVDGVLLRFTIADGRIDVFALP